MKTIAILSSGEGRHIRPIVETFGAGNRIRVAVVVSDRPNAPALETAAGLGIDTASYPRALWDDTPEYIATELRARGVDLIVTDGFDPAVVDSFGNLFPPRVVTLLPDGSNIREILAIESAESARSQSDSISVETPGETVETVICDSPETAMPPRTPDEAWAERLGLDFDPERLKTATPPPVPPMQPAQGMYQSAGAPAVPPPYLQYPAAAPQEEKMPGTYLVWSILSIILCCLIPGVVALVYSCLVSSRFYAKDYEGARKASELAQIWIIVSIVAGVISAAVYLPLSLLGS